MGPIDSTRSPTSVASAPGGTRAFAGSEDGGIRLGGGAWGPRDEMPNSRATKTPKMRLIRFQLRRGGIANKTLLLVPGETGWDVTDCKVRHFSSAIRVSHSRDRRAREKQCGSADGAY